MSENTKARNDKNLEFTPATPQEQLPPYYISLKELSRERHKFIEWPVFQRQEVWPLVYKQAYIDSILLGDPSPAVEGYQEFNLQGESVWGIIDGHQRISTILEFMDGKYKTWTVAQKRHKEPESDPPVQPGKLFEQLDIIAKNYFLDYRLQINKVRKRSERQMTTRFLRIQNHVPLSAAEKLQAHAGKTREAVRQIEQHTFWDDFYEGKTYRAQIFQSSLYLLAMEMTPGGILNLQEGKFIHALVAGKHDRSITDALIDAVIARLDIVAHVYAGAHFSIRGAIIPMYQSILFLEKAGYTFQQKDKGKLTSWISALIIESNRVSGVPSYVRPLNSLPRRAAVQREFWEKHGKSVMTLFGITESSFK